MIKSCIVGGFVSLLNQGVYFEVSKPHSEGVTVLYNIVARSCLRGLRLLMSGGNLYKCYSSNVFLSKGPDIGLQ